MYSWLQRIWYGGQPPPWYLRALAAVFAVGVRLRRALYGRGWLQTRRVSKPVIVVGNLTVGGTGKTPLVIWLVQQLGMRGVRAGVVLRGYGAGARSPLRWVGPDSDPDNVGDEALLIRLRTGRPVVVDRDRARAAAALVPTVDVVIADDGLQHLHLARDFEFAVIDAARGFGNGRLLPAGPLRDPAERLTSVNQVVINGDVPEGIPDVLRTLPGAVRMQLVGATILAVGHLAAVGPDADDGTTAPAAVAAGKAAGAQGQRRPLGDFAGQRVHAIAGIGHPQRFFQTLRTAGIEPIEHAFPDHHRYRQEELEFGDELPLLMTEKDAVKCRRFHGANHWYLPVDSQFAVDDARALLDRLLALVNLLPATAGAARSAAPADGN